MNKIELCIFDLDGTVLNTLHALNKVMNLTLHDYNLEDISINDTKEFVGNGYREYVFKSLKKVIIKKKLEMLKSNAEPKVIRCADEFIDEACDIYIKHFKEHCNYKVEPYDYVVDTLKELKEKGVKLAILTNKLMDIAKTNIYTYFGEDLFNIVYGESKEIVKKPDPSGIYKIMDELDVKDKTKVLMIGDTDVDILVGKNAKIKTCAVSWGYRDVQSLKKENPDYIINDIRQLIDISI